jgi:dethiobiotin synthetase
MTGTDTGVGKTLVSVALLRRLREAGITAAGMKPVASGSERTPAGLRNEDALALAAASGFPFPYDVVNPYAFEPAIAPHVAAAEAGVTIDPGRILAAYARITSIAEAVVVEGAGGWLVPLGGVTSLADLPRLLGLDVVLVVGLRLGCINHALLTAESIARRDVRLAGWVGNAIDPGFARAEASIATLRESLPAPCLGIVPSLAPADPGLAAAHLDIRPLISPRPHIGRSPANRHSS